MFNKIKQKLKEKQNNLLEDDVLMNRVHVWELPFEFRSQDCLLYVLEFRKYHNLATDDDMRYYGYALVQMKMDMDLMEDDRLKRPYTQLYESRRRSYNVARIAKLSKQKEKQVGILRGRDR